MNRNNYPDLPSLSLYRYENFFNIYNDKDNTRFYNLLRAVNLYPAIDTAVEDTYNIAEGDTWIYISYKYYNTMYLWWLVCAYNQIQNPIDIPIAGTTIRLLKSQFVWPIISELTKQSNN